MLYKQGNNVAYGIEEHRFGTTAEFNTFKANEDHAPEGSTAFIANDGGSAAVYMKTSTGWVKL